MLLLRFAVSSVLLVLTLLLLETLQVLLLLVGFEVSLVSLVVSYLLLETPKLLLEKLEVLSLLNRMMLTLKKWLVMVQQEWLEINKGCRAWIPLCCWTVF